MEVNAFPHISRCSGSPQLLTKDSASCEGRGEGGMLERGEPRGRATHRQRKELDISVAVREPLLKSSNTVPCSKGMAEGTRSA